jgi:antitoxin VapB
MGVHESKTFRSGNSVALRLPKGLAIGPDERMRIEQHGDVLTVHRLPSDAEEAERIKRFRAMLAQLATIGPVGEIEVREPFEFPDRAGL